MMRWQNFLNDPCILCLLRDNNNQSDMNMMSISCVLMLGLYHRLYIFDVADTPQEIVGI